MAHELLTRRQNEAAPAITCLSFSRNRSGSLVGFASLHIRAIRQKLSDWPVHVSHGSRWVAALTGAARSRQAAYPR